jgi:predicted HicB family RNase H-like nuclease
MSEQEKPKTININVRFPPDLAAQLKQAAQEEGRSMNSELLWALRDYLARRQRKQH